jgi:hypothetical protein
MFDGEYYHLATGKILIFWIFCLPVGFTQLEAPNLHLITKRIKVPGWKVQKQMLVEISACQIHHQVKLCMNA